MEKTVSWQRQAGGGEQALLGECLLAALDATDAVADAPTRVTKILSEARRRNDAPVEVFALDATARRAANQGDAESTSALLLLADTRMADASHFISELDRVDAQIARNSLGIASDSADPGR